ncbi:tetratricopeptide repeat protein [Candidatus Beckwithbacteria bacterium]|nr:tetratricopeptide repeat protein [Candidatus Beckwithbacteria bacterium]
MDLSKLAIQKALNFQWQQAISLNEEILAQNPNDVDALNRIAQCHLQLGDKDKASAYYQQVIQLDSINPIAKRNLEKIKSLNGNAHIVEIKRLNFIEEPGKTKIISLVRLGEKGVLSCLQSCLPLNMSLRAKSICLYFGKQYVGRFPDDISKKLIHLIKNKNEYEVYVKSVQKNKVSVMVKEIKTSKRSMKKCSFFIG